MDITPTEIIEELYKTNFVRNYLKKRLGAENFNDKKIYRSDKKIEDLIFISKEAFICTADCILKIDWN